MFWLIHLHWVHAVSCAKAMNDPTDIQQEAFFVFLISFMTRLLIITFSCANRKACDNSLCTVLQYIYNICVFIVSPKKKTKEKNDKEQ